jgi:hypothetical protein
MLLLRILRFLHDAQPGDSLALSTDACCEMRQGIWLQAERQPGVARELLVYCENEVPRKLRHGGAGEVLRVAGDFAARTGREVQP